MRDGRGCLATSPRSSSVSGIRHHRRRTWTGDAPYRRRDYGQGPPTSGHKARRSES
jgi:hypothetical protein